MTDRQDQPAATLRSITVGALGFPVLYHAYEISDDVGLVLRYSRDAYITVSCVTRERRVAVEVPPMPPGLSIEEDVSGRLRVYRFTGEVVLATVRQLYGAASVEDIGKALAPYIELFQHFGFSQR